MIAANNKLQFDSILEINSRSTKILFVLEVKCTIATTTNYYRET